MKNIYIALGSNIDKRRNLKKCIRLLKQKFKILKTSNVYETKPVGYLNQASFYNMALEIETKFNHKELFSELMSIEKRLKRIRRKRNYPRTIDIDILFYNKKVIKSKYLVIPHPRLHKRSFVLVPLNEIAPNFKHPILKKTVNQLLKELKKTEIIKRLNFTL